MARRRPKSWKACSEAIAFPGFSASAGVTSTPLRYGHDRRTPPNVLLEGPACQVRSEGRACRVRYIPARLGPGFNFRRYFSGKPKPNVLNWCIPKQGFPFVIFDR